MPSTLSNLEKIQVEQLDKIKKIDQFLQSYYKPKKYVPKPIKKAKRVIIKGKFTRKMNSDRDVLARKMTDVKHRRAINMNTRRMELDIKNKNRKQNNKPRFIVIVHGGNNKGKSTFYLPFFKSIVFYSNSGNLMSVPTDVVPQLPEYICSGYINPVETIKMHRQNIFKKKKAQINEQQEILIKEQLMDAEINHINSKPVNMKNMTFSPAGPNDMKVLVDSIGIYFCNPKKKTGKVTKLVDSHALNQHPEWKKGFNIETLMIMLSRLQTVHCPDISPDKIDVHILSCRFTEQDTEEIHNVLDYISSHENSTRKSNKRRTRSFRSDNSSSGKMDVE